MSLLSQPAFSVVLMAAYILLVACVYQFEKNKDSRKHYDANYAKAQLEAMARGRNLLFDKLKLAEHAPTPVSLMTIVKEIEESMSIVHLLGAVNGDYTRPHLSYITCQDAILFVFKSKATEVEIEFIYPRYPYLLA